MTSRAGHGAVTPGGVLRLWLPLAASGTILTVEIPVIAALVARGPQGVASLAAFGVALSLIILINGPALALAGTTTAMGRTRPDVARLRLYAALVGSLLAALLALVLLTPPGDALLGGIMGLDPGLVDLARLGLWLLAPAPLAVAWRRHHQGLLIRVGSTDAIALATVVRILVSLGTAALLLAYATWPGVALGALGLTAGAVAEAVVVSAAAQRKRDDLGEGERPPPWRGMMRFHLPLAGTVMLSMLAQPLVTAGIARGPSSAASLAAWPVLYGLISLLGGPTTEVENVTVALVPRPSGVSATGVFSLELGGVLAGVFALLAATPLITLYLVDFSGLAPEPAGLAAGAAVVTLVVPLLFALRGWLRGCLLARRRALDVQWAMAASLVVLAGVLAMGILGTAAPGLHVGALGLTGAIAAEVALLGLLARRAERRLRRPPAVAATGAAAGGRRIRRRTRAANDPAAACGPPRECSPPRP